jgi:CubicO group peptidase (beta-lactamase class C family)
MLIKISITTFSIIVLISGLLYAFAPHPPRTPQTVNSADELNDIFQAIVDGGGAPAISVVVVKDGSTIYSEAFGNATETTQATPDTVYHWWSMTKVFTAVSILQLHEQGKLNIDEPVINYVPFFEVEGKNGSNPTITIRQLLNHTSGLGDTMPAMIGWIHTEDTTYNQTELLREQLPNFNNLRSEPGTDAAYTNLGYIVLSAVVEAASGPNLRILRHGTCYSTTGYDQY